ncbi:Autophagy protein 7 [Dinochytrium kinnereticum]|nr:Autophagy protein 7 [Dinochytrium kinnereticum]
MPSTPPPLQFEAFASAVDATFWHALASRKVELFRLDDTEREIKGYYSIGGAPSSSSAILSAPSSPTRTASPALPAQDFKAIDKAEAIASVGRKIWDAIKSKEALKDPSILTKFLLLTFADLKKYKFYFWFAFPAFNLPDLFTLAPGERVRPLKDVWTADQVTSLHATIRAFRATPESSPFFLLKTTPDSSTIQISSLSSFQSFFSATPPEDRIIGFFDPSSLPSNPGWPLRNFLALMKDAFDVSRVQVVCFREHGGDISPTIWLKVEMPGGDLPDEMPKCVGWEKNGGGKLGPRVADLAPLMDPMKLADTAVDLNLKLMRWRIMPGINLEKIAGTKCLLLGSGTLGCYVARALLAWGVRHVTFVDNGTVSFSNPVRQPLFTYEDCLDGGKPKAKAAADGLKRVFPGVIVITAAIGFDTFVVMRHGMRGIEGQTQNLGCYFCNDVVAPRDSLSDRTLDQQCTVSRPGLALLAGGQAVELLVSILNHPDGALADADKPLDPTEPTPNFFGLVPHQIRGFLAHFTNLLISGQGYDRCIACSDKILNEFDLDRDGFMKKVIASPKYLEEVTGLLELFNDTDAGDVEWMEGEDE